MTIICPGCGADITPPCPEPHRPECRLRNEKKPARPYAGKHWRKGHN